MIRFVYNDHIICKRCRVRKMDIKANTQPARSAGRPRSEASRASILDTAYGFLRGHPVSAISIIHIARKAGVSTATVYRWWSTKEALLLDAFLYKADHEPVLGCGGLPLERLKEYILQVGRIFTGENGAVVARLLTAIQEDQALRKEFLNRIYSPRDKEIRSVVNEAIKRGDLPGELEISIFLDSIIGPLLARLLFRHEQIDESFVAAVFENVVAGTKIQRRQNRKYLRTF
jgi:AcrR family transcriptional regulator